MNKTRYLTYMAMLLTLTVVLSILESMLPSFSAIPGVKPGLANITVMFTLFFVGRKQAFALNVAKALFVVITRGVTAGILSLCGGILSLLAIILLMYLSREKASYMILSITGAIFHNIGQIAAVTVILANKYTIVYAPVLIVSGVVMGTVTGTLLKVLLPVLAYPLKKSGVER